MHLEQVCMPHWIQAEKQNNLKFITTKHCKFKNKALSAKCIVYKVIPHALYQLNNIIIFQNMARQKHFVCKVNKAVQVQSPIKPSAGITGVNYL
jgi:hypothetical protein